MLKNDRFLTVFREELHRCKLDLFLKFLSIKQNFEWMNLEVINQNLIFFYLVPIDCATLISS